MGFKNSLTNIVGRICECSLLRPYVRQSALRSFNVVYYHFIGRPAPHYQSFYSGCTLSRFENDLRRLNQLFEFASLNEVLDDGNAKRPLLAVTFDDGFDLSCEGVMDLLDQYGVHATTFVITSCIGNRRLMWRHALSAIRNLVPEDRLLAEYNAFAYTAGLDPIDRCKHFMPATARWDMKQKDKWAATLWQRCKLPAIEDYLAERRPYFDWNTLSRWIDAGHSVGFHTHTHPFCSKLTRADLETELVAPALELKHKLGLQDLCLSYPFGDRLQPLLEQEIFQSGLFRALFGIRGFQRKGVTRDKLERAGVESRDVGWGVFATHVLGSIGGNGLAKAIAG